jgi:hypothetical protein
MTRSQADTIIEVAEVELKAHGYKYDKTNKHSENRITKLYEDKNKRIKIFAGMFRNPNENPTEWVCSLWAFSRKTFGQIKMHDPANYINEIKEFIKTCSELISQDQNDNNGTNHNR